MILFMHCGTKYCTRRETRHGLFNAALRALLNRPVSHLAPRAVFVPNAFTIINYSFIISHILKFLQCDWLKCSYVTEDIFSRHVNQSLFGHPCNSYRGIVLVVGNF